MSNYIQDVPPEILAVDAPDSIIDISKDQFNNTSSFTENEKVLVKSREGVKSRLTPLECSIGAVKVEQDFSVKDKQPRNQFNNISSSTENGGVLVKGFPDYCFRLH